jgi:hypothetical protein
MSIIYKLGLAKDGADGRIHCTNCDAHWKKDGTSNVLRHYRSDVDKIKRTHKRGRQLLDEHKQQTENEKKQRIDTDETSTIASTSSSTSTSTSTSTSSSTPTSSPRAGQSKVTGFFTASQPVDMRNKAVYAFVMSSLSHNILDTPQFYDFCMALANSKGNFTYPSRTTLRQAIRDEAEQVEKVTVALM